MNQKLKQTIESKNLSKMKLIVKSKILQKFYKSWIKNASIPIWNQKWNQKNKQKLIQKMFNYCIKN